MDTVIGKNVTWSDYILAEKIDSIGKVTVNELHFSILNGELIVSSPYEWVNNNNKVVRRGVSRHSQSSLVEKLGNATAIPLINAIRSVLDTTMAVPVAQVNIDKNEIVSIVASRFKASPIRYDHAGVDQLLQTTGMTTGELKQAVRSLVNTLVS